MSKYQIENKIKAKFFILSKIKYNTKVQTFKSMLKL